MPDTQIFPLYTDDDLISTEVEMTARAEPPSHDDPGSGAEFRVTAFLIGGADIGADKWEIAERLFPAKVDRALLWCYMHPLHEKYRDEAREIINRKIARDFENRVALVKALGKLEELALIEAEENWDE